MKLILLDRNENYLRNIEGVVLAERHVELNRHDLLMLETLGEVEKEQRILYRDELHKWHEYIVKEVKKLHDTRVHYSVYCESSFYETIGDYIEDKRPTDTTATSALSIALEPTRWQVGQVDDLGLNSTSFYQIPAKEAVHKVAEVWKGEIRTRVTIEDNTITGRYVDLKSKVGNELGKRFTYSKDIVSITKTVARNDVVTALYGYGRGEEIGDGYGRRLKFGEINGGVDYVEDTDARAIWGRLNSDGSRAHVFDKVVFDSVEDMTELKELTEARLEEISKPLVSYTADVLDLKAAGFDHEGVDLGDTCLVIDRDFEPELRITARVVSMVEDLVHKRKKVTLGNYLPLITDSLHRQEEFINDFRARANIWDRSGSFGEDGTLNTNFLDGVINVAKNKLLSAQSGWYTDDSGNIVLDAVDGLSSMRLSGAGFQIANTKLPNDEWDYRTFGTGDGFLADMLIAGTIMGGNVSWNLEDGTFIIGNPQNPVFKYDGSLYINLSGNTEIQNLQQAIDDIDFEDAINAAYENIGTLDDNMQSKFEDYEFELSEHEDRIEGAEEAADLLSQGLQNLGDATDAITTILGEHTATWEFVDTYISMTPLGLWIGDATYEDGTGILIGGVDGTDNRISFRDKGTEVSFISNQLMRILHGIFVQSAVISGFQFQNLGGPNILAVRYVGS